MCGVRDGAKAPMIWVCGTPALKRGVIEVYAYPRVLAQCPGVIEVCAYHRVSVQCTAEIEVFEWAAYPCASAQGYRVEKNPGLSASAEA